MNQTDQILLQPSAAGLSSEEAKSLLLKFGPNVLRTQSGTPWWKITLRQFASTLILILIFAAAVAIFMGQLVDGIAILAIVFLNGCLGFFQEWKAERTLEALRSMLSHKAIVVRDGVETQIPVSEIVVGDLLILRTGEKVPADVALQNTVEFQVDESVLTGESDAVHKSFSAIEPSQRKAFMGTNVVQGHAEALVTATGMNTKFGEIAELTTELGEKTTHLQKKLELLGRQLGVMALILALLIVLIGWLSGRAPLDMVMTGLSLAVAVVPEGLPAVVTLTLALGARAMVAKNALSKRLQASETLGAASVICTDKTGTLTENQMTVTQIWLPVCGVIDVTGTGYDPAGHFEKDGKRFDYSKNTALKSLLSSAMICNHASIQKVGDHWQEIGQPTEVALIVAGYKAWLPMPSGENLVREFPFTSERKRMSVVCAEDGRAIVHIKGALEKILPLCSEYMGSDGVLQIDQKMRDQIKTQHDFFAGKGLRVLAIAQRKTGLEGTECSETERDLTFLGLVAIIDPPRPEVKNSIALAKSAGIKVIMITGDAPQTALAIASSLHLPSTIVVTGDELQTKSDDELDHLLAQDVMFARTTPEHKMRIVRRLQSHGHVVAMTGDGVNDAPALKQSDIGVAMGIRGTDVAKDAADLVLLDDNFASIVGAIEEGRRQYANIKKFVRYLLASNAGEVVAITGSIILGGPLIFLPIQILWMNLVTDGFTALSLGLEKSEANIMEEKPRSNKDGIIGAQGMATIMTFAIYTGVSSLLVFHYMLEYGVIVAQTVAFTTMIFLEKFSVFAFRSLSLPWSAIGFFSNYWLLGALTMTLGLQVLVVYWPPLQQILHVAEIPLEFWGLIALITLPIVIVPELIKVVRQMRLAS